jgi:nucleotide-binding universal stress UspA family protein
MTLYHRVLVPLEHSPYDRAVLAHVGELARVCDATVILIHVADGFAARNLSQLDLRESEEMREDREYLNRMAAQLEASGLAVDAVLANGDPAREIAAAAEREHCDLIAMATHGHRFWKDLFYGSVAEAVRHRSTVPVLMVRGSKTGEAAPSEGGAGGGEDASS